MVGDLKLEHIKQKSEMIEHIQHSRVFVGVMSNIQMEMTVVFQLDLNQIWTSIQMMFPNHDSRSYCLFLSITI